MTKNSADCFLPAPSRLDRLLGGSRRRFYVALFVNIALALAALFVASREQAGRIELINEIDGYLQREVALLDKDIVELRNFRALMTALLVRKRVVEAVQADRGVAVSVLNFFVEKTPAGVMLTDLRYEGRSLLVRGVSRAAIRERGSTLYRKENGNWAERRAGTMQSPLMDLVRNMEEQEALFVSVELLESRNVDDVEKAAMPDVDAQAFTLKVMLATSAKRKDDANSRDAAEEGRGGSGKSEPTSSLVPGDESMLISSGLLVLAMASGIAIWWRRRLNLKLACDTGAVSTHALLRSVWARLGLTRPAVVSRDIASWSGAQRASVVLAVLVVTLLCGHWLLIDPQIDEREARFAKVVELREAWAVKKHQAVNLDLYSEQVARGDLVLGLLLRQLPNGIEANAFLALLANLAVNQGLSGPQLSPGKEQLFDFYAMLPVRISVTGSFMQIGRFLAGISQLDRIAIVRDFSIRKESGSLALDATVLIFRYVDDDELAAVARQRKAAKGEGK